MKWLMIRFLLLFVPLVSFGQKKATLTIFSEYGDPFYVFLNGMKINDSAVTKIRLVGLAGDEYLVKTEFKSARLQPVEKVLPLIDGNERMADVTYKIRKDKNGMTRFVLHSMFSPEPVIVDNEPKTKVVYFRQPNESDLAQLASTTNSSKKINKAEVKEQPKALLSNVRGATVSIPNKEVKTPSQTQSTPTQTDVAKTEFKTNAQSSAPTEKEITKITEGKQVSAPVQNKTTAPAKEKATSDPNKTEQPVAKKEPTPAKVAAKPAKTAKEVSKEEYPMRKCNDWPMMKEEYLKAKGTVEAVKGDKLRLEKAKQVALNYCLLVSQISDLSNLFESEETILSFLKYAYGCSIDRTNYARLEKLLSNANHIKDFKAFLAQKTQE
jgi:hypothetical protein